jgi:hypothetical protein
VTPEPGVVQPSPAPAPDRGVLVEIHVDAIASGESASLDYSNAVVCALEGVPALGKAPVPAPGLAFANDAARTAASSGEAGLPIVVAVVISAAAVAARGSLVRRR